MYVCVVVVVVVVKGKGGRRGGCVQKKESGEHRQKRHMNLGWAKFIKINTSYTTTEMVAPF